MTHTYQTAGMPARTFAFLVDFLLIGMVSCAFLFVSMGKTPTKLQASGDEGRPSLMDKYQFFAYSEPIIMDANRIIYIKNFAKKYPMEGFVGLFLIPFLYLSIFDSMFGGGVGKLMTGIRIKRKDGGKINFMTAAIRAIGKMISVGIFFLGCIMALFDKKKQALHDKIANTLVLKR